MQKKINFLIDELGCVIVNDNALLIKINGASGWFDKLAGWDFSCDNLCGCNPSCHNNRGCNVDCPTPPNSGCNNDRCIESF